MRAAVIGGGSWGTALAAVLGSNGHEVVVWAHDPDVARALTEKHENPKYLTGLRLPDRVSGTHDLGLALAGAELVVAASPSHVTRPVMRDALPALPKATPIVCATKGIENDTLLTMHEVLEDVLPAEMHPYLVCLSGPSFAKETVLRLPTAVVVASPWEKMAQRVQRWFSNDYFRVYTSVDVVGVELGGSLKNVCAIAAGISDGMGFGNNTRAAIMTRGLAELVRLAVRKGANPLTLSGLAGMGDLVLTCTGELSRNRTVGLALGRGQKLQEILAGMTQAAEGRSAVAHVPRAEVGVPAALESRTAYAPCCGRRSLACGYVSGCTDRERGRRRRRGRASSSQPAELTVREGGSSLSSSSFSICASRCDDPAMMIGRKSRLSTGVASRAAVDSENPTETARFDSMSAISPRESSASLSQSRAKRRIGPPRIRGRRAAPCLRKRTNHGSGASLSRWSDSLSDSPGKRTCASSKASATTQCKLQIPRIAVETKSPIAGTSRASTRSGATPMATIRACRIMRPASKRHGISRGPQAPKPNRQRIIAASRA